MAKKRTKKRKYIAKVQRYFTDLTDAQWHRVRPILQEVLSVRYQRSLGKSPWPLREYVNALAWISLYRTRWNALPREFPPVDAVYRFHRYLRDCRALRRIRAVLPPDTPFGLERGYRRNFDPANVVPVRDRRADLRKCDACPRCHNNTMICYKTRKQGSRVVRYYRCKNCGHRRVWLDLPQGKGWQGMMVVPCF